MKTTQLLKLAILAGTGFVGAGMATQAAAFTLPATGYVQYGDGLS